MFFSSWRRDNRTQAAKGSTSSPRRRRSKWSPGIEVLEDRLTPTTHVWSGGVSNLWTVPGNWSSGGVPQPGEDHLVIVFPSGAAAHSTNNIPQTLTIGEIDITGAPAGPATGYTIDGNAIRLGNGTPFNGSTGNPGNIEDNSGNANNVINFAGITLGPDAVPLGHDISAVDPGTVTVQSPITGTADLTINFPPSTATLIPGGGFPNGEVALTGTISYTGTTTVDGGILSIFTAPNTTQTLTLEGGPFSGNSIFFKDGAGTLLLNGNNTFAGGTGIAAGVLDVNGSQSNSPVNIAPAGTLGGTGTTGPVGIFPEADNGEIDPAGPGAAGTLTTKGNVLFGNGSSFDVDIFTSQHDLYNVQGNADVSSATLHINSAGLVAAVGTQFTVLTAAPLSGHFLNAPIDGDVVTSVDGKDFRVNYVGNSVVLTLETPVTPDIITAAGPAVVLGSGNRLTDSAILSNGFNPTGTITFTLTAPGGSVVYTDVVPVNGNGNYSTSQGNNPGGYLPTAVGTYQWVASYSGDSNNNPVASSFGSEPEQVTPPTPAIATAAGPAVALGSGNRLTDSATLSKGFNPTGTITFTLFAPDGVTVAYTDVVQVSGNGTYRTSQGNNPGGFLPTAAAYGTGLYQWVARYSGDANNNPRATPFGGEPEQVNKGTVTANLTSSPNPSAFGQPVTFTDAVTSPTGPAPTGMVQFLDNGTPIGGPVQIQNGSASVTTSSLSVGSHAITAQYLGDGVYGPDRRTLTQTVNKGTVSVSAPGVTPPSIAGGGTATLSVTVTPVSPAPATPSGPVTFSDNGTPIDGPVQLQNGQASITTGPLSPGSHSFTATYGGDTNFAGPVTSPATTITVGLFTTTTTLSVQPTAISLGQTVTMTATVSGGPSPLGGTVQFSDNGTPLDGPVPLQSNGTASFSTNGLSVGTHSITAVYGGDPNHSGSPSAPQTVTVARIVHTWRGGDSASPTAWSDPNNWIGGAPTEGDADLLFPAAAQSFLSMDDIQNVTIHSIEIQGTGYTINGQPITLDNTRAAVISGAAFILSDGPAGARNTIGLGIVLTNNSATPATPNSEGIAAAAGNTLVIDGLISGGSGLAHLAVNGAISPSSLNTGTVLFNAANTYTIPTDVAGGTLGGTGQVGTTDVFAGANLDPGTDSAPGRLTVNGALTLHTGSTLVMRLNSDTRAGQTYDQVLVRGQLTLGDTTAGNLTPSGNPTLDLVLGPNFSSTASPIGKPGFTLLQTTGSPVLGRFQLPGGAALPGGSLFVHGSQPSRFVLELSYQDDTGNNVGLTSLNDTQLYIRALFDGFNMPLDQQLGEQQRNRLASLPVNQIADTFLASQQNRMVTLTTFYQTLGLPVPSPTDPTFRRFLGQLMTPDPAAAGTVFIKLATSKQVTRMHRGNKNFLRFLITAVLGSPRAISKQQRLVWLQGLNQGTLSRAMVIEQFLSSDPVFMKAIRENLATFLDDNNPSQAEVNSFLAQIKNGQLTGPDAVSLAVLENVTQINNLFLRRCMNPPSGQTPSVVCTMI
jgi:autotransporter-associated beta strand protein